MRTSVPSALDLEHATTRRGQSHNTGDAARSGNNVRCRVDKPQNKQMKSNLIQMLLT